MTVHLKNDDEGEVSALLRLLLSVEEEEVMDPTRKGREEREKKKKSRCVSLGKGATTRKRSEVMSAPFECSKKLKDRPIQRQRGSCWESTESC